MRVLLDFRINSGLLYREFFVVIEMHVEEEY